ncbi:zinc-binding alcohol dehydrogenase family protein [Ideonella sp. BN130291]|uniref:zinc-binding alcohol dehydrogenase family protein n=1 Tax=Ideonella sp. BN130291 TaxID=3112940 RepID=UPI002E25FF81|nr:zinc-binding alcohol dehydrogenase family protein [Ideonella sp. BN130291]
MKAVAYQQAQPTQHAEALLDIDLPDPVATGHDLLVEVKAVSVNPVDTKVRRSTNPPPGQWKVLGWDAAGVVRAVGDQVTGFQPGDRVWYAGAIDRPGSNSELQRVDARIAAPMPASLGFAEAAALPLTAITAWELLFDRLGVAPGKAGSGGALLVVGAAGGVGSILVQLARRLTTLTVIGTAARPESQAWVRSLGAHHVIDHRQPIAAELTRLGLAPVQYVASLTHTAQHWPQLIEALAPQGRLALIDDPETPLDVTALKRKSLSLHWEMMFTRSLFQTPDMAAQGRLLGELARLVDDGLVRSTLAQHGGRINAANLRQAHALIESGQSRGKVVLEGF